MRGIFTPFFKKHRKNYNALCGFGNICLPLPSVKSMTVARTVGNKRTLATGDVGKERSVLRFGKETVLIGMNLKKERGEKRTNGGKPRGGGKCYPKS